MAANKFCSACGAALTPDARFCESCGFNVSGGATPPPPASLPVPFEVPQFVPKPSYLDEVKVIPAGQIKDVAPITPPMTADAPVPFEVPQFKPAPSYLDEVKVIPAGQTKDVAPTTPPPPAAAQTQGQYSADGKLRWENGQWVSNAQPYLSSDGLWRWDGTGKKWVSNTYRQVSPDGKWIYDGANWIPNPDVFMVTPMPAVAAPSTPKVKRKHGGAKLIAPILILAGAFALGWFFWPYELLIAVAGATIATLAWWNPRGMGTRIKVIASKLKLPGMKPSLSGRAAAAFLALSLVAFPAVAGLQGHNAQDVAANLPQQITLYGTAFLSTPLTGASVNVYELGSDGKQGTRLGTATTDSNGYWNMDVSRHPQGTLLVATSLGSYVDEISKKPVTTTSNDSLKTVLLPTYGYAQLTPLTTFAASRTVPMIASGTPATRAWYSAYFTVARQYNLDVDTLWGVTPTISNDPTDVLSTTRAARQEGLILAGLDQEAATLGTSEFALTDAIAADLSDGKLDGKEGATPILLDHGAALDKDAGTGGLQKGIDKVAPSPGFDNHIPTPQVLLAPINIGLNGAGLFPATTALPAFVNGRGAHVALEGLDGTKPYYCDPVEGIPAGFSMSNSCVLYYDGTDILGTSVQKMLPAFNVTMTDSSSPKQSVTFSLTITVTQKPPEVTGIGGTCPQATKPCTLTIMSVKYGTPPYTYSKQCCDSLPLGMFIDLFKPILSGKPAKAGTYTATVCATDLVGDQGCGPVTVVVEAGPSPSPQASAPTNSPPQSNLPPGFPTNLPNGTYSFQFCTQPIPPYYAGGCQSAGTQTMSNGDAQQMVSFLQSLSSTYLQDGCTTRYSAWNGTEFDFFITCTDTSGGGGGTVTDEIKIIKVG